MIFSELFRIILWQPLFNLLILLYLYLPGHDFGIAIIVLTVLIRLILWPWQKRAIKSQMVFQKIQPKIKELQKKYKNDKEKLGKEFLKLTKNYKVNPFAGLLLTLVQLPILIALYRVFWRGLDTQSFQFLYPFVQRPETLDSTFLGMIDLAQPNFVLAFLVGLFMFFQQKIYTPQTKITKGSWGMIQAQMLYFMPMFMVLIFLKIPSALALYVCVSTLFSIFQQRLIKKDLEGYGTRNNQKNR